MGGGHVELIELVKRFADVTAVDGIQLDIPGGEFFSLLGPSGCGKTTTLRLIAGFEQPTSGRIRLDGEDMAHTPPHRRPVNTVFQNYALFPHLNVRDNVAFGLRFKDLSKQEKVPLVPFMLDGVAQEPANFQADRLHPLATAHPTILNNIWPQLAPLIKE